MAFALLLLLAPAGAWAQAALDRLDLSENDGYGRMIFSFQGAVPKHRIEINAGVMVLAFDRAVSVNLDEFARQMPRFIATVRQDDDGKTLRFALKADFWSDAKQAEMSLYVDLMPSQWTHAAPPLPAEVVARIAAAAAEKRAAEEAKAVAAAQGIVEPDVPLPGLDVRVARHEGISRLVFDWNQPVLYSLVQRQGLATITFDRTATVDLSSLRVDPPPFLSHATAIEHEGRLAVILTLKPGVVITDFREDMAVVLDLKPGNTRDNAEVPVAAGPTDIRPQAARPEAKEEPAEEEVAASGEVGTDAVEAKAEDASAADAAPAAAAGPMPASVRPVGEAVASIRDGRGGTDIVVSWPEPVGAAVFERADRLWMVFDEALPIDTAGLVFAAEAGSPAPFGEPEVVRFDGGVALVLPLHERVLVSVVEEGADWRISAGETLQTTGRPIAISRNWREDGRGSVTFDLKATRKVFKFEDRRVGDMLIVATARGPSQAVQTPHSFVEFQVLQTSQGIAIVPIADDLIVAAAPDNVVVSRQDGLMLSGDAGNAVSGGILASATALPAVMEFDAWRVAPGRNFIERRQFHLDRLAAAVTQEIGAARFDYAKFLLGYGLAQEALAALNAAAIEDAALIKDPAFRGVKGVAEAMSGRYVDAIRSLSGNGLDNIPHAAVWRGLARAQLGHWDAARAQFALAGAVMDSFDDGWRTIFRARAAEAALAANDVDGARHHAAAFPEEPEGRRAQAEIMLVDAMIADRLGRTDEALVRYDRAIENGYPPIAARARFGKAVLLNKTGEIDNDALAEELESLRYAWRGDALELEVLSKLASLHLESGGIVDALKIMRIATANYPDSDHAHRMNMQMSDLFADFFLGEDASRMTPLQALAFFESFKDLTPIGQRGDEMIRHLAERLVEADLLLQAAQLLDYQVANRLHGGVAKAQVAARLAAILLLDEKPENALAALRATKQNLLPEALAERRLLIEARALAELKQYDYALDLLEERNDALSRTLRADVLWQAGRWEEAGDAFEAMLGDSWKAEAALSDDTRLQVMRAAVAYSLAGDEGGLSRLRTKFGEAMSRSADAGAFAVVSDPIVEQGVAFRELASRIASIDTMERFVTSLKDNASSAIN
ncbi:hypothetical protein [Parvibaculum sp.]|uniref:hypothetical protein n=1 Tax=Parvibaculum sp. TaxID=2024848 RepID=UPI001DA9358B|nr:hypothetical protein [Parvibaculum sp.]MBX3488406.1 hypothetical protein [Parvibaculum sp.]MCW5727614.1 hypothetical protein [Parvibaculum sp.]